MQVQLVIPQSISNRRSKLFPVLVILLLACYGILTLVVIEQGHVIQSQRNLILQLFQDSTQLTALKGQEGAQRAIEKKQSEALAKSKARHSSAAPIPKEQSQKLLSRKSQGAGSKQASKLEKEKQPLQAVDKVDRRRFPSQI